MNQKRKGNRKGNDAFCHRFCKIRWRVDIDLTSRPERIAANILYQKLGFIRRETNAYRYKMRINTGMEMIRNLFGKE
jgi:ribosomal protein S18 acetylase RimI-like enzyme